MSAVLQQQVKSLLGQTAYFATTGTFFGVAVIAAAARAFIRIHHLKRINADDYLFFVAVAALIAGTGLFFAFMGTSYDIYAIAVAISEGILRSPPNLIQEIENAAIYAFITEILSWTTIFLVKFTFLFYFRGLVNRLHKMEIWWWVTFAVFVPITGIMIPGLFIVCPHTGPSVFLKCNSSPGFLRREYGFVYFQVASDIVTDIMLVSIPVIVLRKSSFDLRRKLSIAAVLCLSLLMVAIGVVRVISASALGTRDQTFDIFWVQLEASVSVIAACPTAFRSLFLINHHSNKAPARAMSRQGQRSVFERLWGRTKPTLPSIRVGANLTGMRIVISGSGMRPLESQDADGYALSSVLVQSLHSSPSLEGPKRSAEATHEPV